MRWRRNQFVHSAVSSNERDQLCYIIKDFVDVHLMRLVRNDFSVNSIKDYGEFLGLPHVVERLNKLRDWYQHAFEFQSSFEQDSDDNVGWGI
jgi:hypothetical protein